MSGAEVTQSYDMNRGSIIPGDPAVNKDALFGDYQSRRNANVDWRDKLHQQAAYKALDIANVDEPMIYSAPTTTVNHHYHQATSPTAPSLPAPQAPVVPSPAAPRSNVGKAIMAGAAIVGIPLALLAGSLFLKPSDHPPPQTVPAVTPIHAGPTPTTPPPMTSPTKPDVMEFDTVDGEQQADGTFLETEKSMQERKAGKHRFHWERQSDGTYKAIPGALPKP